MIQNFAAVFIGGGIGSIMRYGVQLALNERMSATSFPWATFAVNIIGSFLIGLFYSLSERFNIPAETRLLLTTGLCGGFTTFSTFSNESVGLIKQGSITTFAVYAALSLTLGMVAALAGGMAGKA